MRDDSTIISATLKPRTLPRLDDIFFCLTCLITPTLHAGGCLLI